MDWYWPFWFACEFVVVAATAYAWFGPHRRAQHYARVAREADNESDALFSRGEVEDAKWMFVHARFLYQECFAWYAVTRRIQTLAIVTAIPLVLISTARLIFT